MHGLRHSHYALHMAPRVRHDEVGPMEDLVMHRSSLQPPILAERQSSSSTSSSSSCAAGDNSAGCQLPTSTTSSTTLPIALGVVIPLVSALVVFIYLHRRHVKKQRIEDANDKHASLDYGMGERHGRSKNTNGGPEMSGIVDPEGLLRPRPGRGMSMDMLSSPFVPPAEMADSRPSFQSLSRSAHDDEDPYRLVVDHNHGPYPAPVRSINRADSAAASTTTGRSSRSTSVGMKTNLLKHAQIPSSTTPPAEAVYFAQASPHDRLEIPEPPPAVIRKPIGSANGMEKSQSVAYPPVEIQDYSALASVEEHPVTHPGKSRFSGSNNLGTPGNIDRSSPYTSTPPIDDNERPLPALPIRTSSVPVDRGLPVIQEPEANGLDDWATYADVLGIAQEPSYEPESEAPHMEETSNTMDSNHLGIDVQHDLRRYSGIRPLPPDEIIDNPEQRAYRIRSFYKEYFDENRPDPVGQYSEEDYYYYDGDEYAEYDYGQEHQHEGPIYDPIAGEFVCPAAPYAEPVTRRAMTPPPRAPPRFQSTHRSNFSSGQFSYGAGRRGQRAYSSSSGRYGNGMRGRAPRKNLPPPAALTTLPTPHMLKSDTAIFNPLDFAPPPTYKDRQQGRPASPLGEKRPYSPSVRSHTPLASSFDELAPMPSPHLLRKSGTFTALDFAPTPRFRGAEGMGSDAGSIRSAGSAMSSMHYNNVRNGAYRVSRMPAGIVGTKHDFAASLRPTWDQRQ